MPFLEGSLPSAVFLGGPPGGLKEEPGMYLRPRRAYDHVVRVERALSLTPLLHRLTSRAMPSVSLREPVGNDVGLPLCQVVPSHTGGFCI